MFWFQLFIITTITAVAMLTVQTFYAFRYRKRKPLNHSLVFVASILSATVLYAIALGAIDLISQGINERDAEFLCPPNVRTIGDSAME